MNKTLQFLENINKNTWNNLLVNLRYIYLSSFDLDELYH